MERLASQEEGNEDQIVVPLAVMKQFFDSLLDRIISAGQSCLDRVGKTGHRCDYMLVVGGFGGSPYLIARLREAFSHQVRKEVVCPGVPSQAVLKGICSCLVLPCACGPTRHQSNFFIIARPTKNTSACSVIGSLLEKN